jgi:outer membrane immunogenic protein
MKANTLGFAAALVVGLGFAPAAFAADLEVKAPPLVAPPSWTGIYIGVNGGYGWSNGTITESPFQSFPGPAVVPQAFLGQNVDGAVFGAHAGYNWQWAALVLGAEGDFDAASMANSSQVVLPDPIGGGGGTANDLFMAHQNVTYLASIRGRLGYALGPNLAYVTGGGAWESLRTNVGLATDTAAGTFSEAGTASLNNTVRSGWVVGTGYEWMITPNWLIRAEYLHYAFSGGNSLAVTVPCGFGGPGATCGGNVSSSTNNIDVVRLGVSFKTW